MSSTRAAAQPPPVSLLKGSCVTKRFIAIAFACMTAGCAIPGQLPQPASQFASVQALRPLEMPGSLHWLAYSGLGYAKTPCGGGFTPILGGVYSAKATDVGTGFPGSDGNSWVGASATYDLLTTYALCAPSYESTSYFQRVYAYATKLKKSATAACPSGGMVLQGWAYGAPKYEGAEIKNNKPVGWIAGGSSTAVAVAECATAQEINLSLTWKSGSGYIACDGDNDDVIGGFFGRATAAGGPAPPERAFPSNGSAGSTTPMGFSFLDKSGSTAWVVCQED